jgi:crotonobetainyl-CoA:carnitine CoA-transferase CaiB-like acyl-CoA transferase
MSMGQDHAPAALGPLAGIRVLDLTAVVSGPLATQILADQGAEVIKIEPPNGGDHGRFIGPGFEGFSALFAACNRNKRSLVIDLAVPEGVELARALARQVDVFIQNFRPGVAERLGLGYQTLTSSHPDLIYVSISGFGPDGPYASRRAYDAVIQALSGLADSQAAPGGEPALVSSLICDKVAALTAAQAITAALFARDRGQGGRHVSVSLLDANLAFNWPDVMWNQTFGDPSFAPGAALAETYRLWKTADGHVAIVFMGPNALRDWSRALGADPALETETFESVLAQRARWFELVGVWEALIGRLTTDEALQRFHAQSIPAGPVRRREALMDDAQIRHNRAVVEIMDPARGPIRMARAGARFSGFEPPSPASAPEMGRHSREILADFGLSAGDIDALLRARIVRQHDPARPEPASMDSRA